MAIPKGGGGVLLRLSDNGNFELVEGETYRSIAPHWLGNVLRIGCTSVTNDAFDKLVKDFGKER